MALYHCDNKSDARWPLISEMTAPTINSNRVKDVVGGYKQIGKTVYVDVYFTINMNVTFDGATYPRFSNWGILNNLPTEKYYTCLPCMYLDVNQYFCDLLINVKSGNIALSSNNNFSTSIGDTVHVRGTYEAS